MSEEKIITIYDFKDSAGNLIGTFDLGFNEPQNYVGTIHEGVTVAEVTLNLVVSRRETRRLVFAQTIDIMNPVWYNSLSETQKTELENWRSAWLQFPNDPDPEAGPPDDLEWLLPQQMV